MAITAVAFPNAPAGVESNLAKVVVITVPEADAINIDTVFTFAALGLGSFTQDPEFKSLWEATAAGVVVTGAACISIFGVDAIGFHVIKTSIAAGAVDHLFVATFWNKRFFEV
jgi:hypothetical protein